MRRCRRTILRSDRLGELIGTGIRVRRVDLLGVGQHLGHEIDRRHPCPLDQALAVLLYLDGLLEVCAAVT